jgi:predicted nuclease of predicted toxin-antitoxin system
VKLLLDMNLAPRWVQWLRAVGVDAVHWTEVGSPTATDATIFSYAHQHGLVVFTHDLDFGALLAHTRARGPSVIQVRAQDTSPEAVGQLILSALQQHAESLGAGALLTVDPSKARVRILPIR